MPTSDFPDNATAAFLGLACGDAYGRTLEFVRGERVRTLGVDVSAGAFRWTDDTHMALYLAEAVLAQGPDTLDEDSFGAAVGERFSDWLDDPLMPSTAPGATCLAGARNWKSGRDWRKSGVPGSDGCGAVMRIVSLAIAFAGDDLDRAARVSAALTHAHPNAVVAAVAACRLLREALEQGRFDAGMVAGVIATLPRLPAEGGVVAEALEAAIRLGADGDADWLDERAIPDGDGGWRAPSALGLAVAAGLRWGGDFAKAIDRAARIDGDSDSVACLAGMFLGAAGGTRVLPQAWVSALPERARIESLSRSLAVRGQPWVAVADLHGHLAHLDALLAWVDVRLPNAHIVLLGDYCDNGPDVPGLLERILSLQEQRGARFVAIAGNHDLACIKAVDSVGGPDAAAWWGRWTPSHWIENGTPRAYGAKDGFELAQKMPAAHQALLRSLPWQHDTGRYQFVHAGMHAGGLEAQRRDLDAKILPDGYPNFPDQIRGVRCTKVADPKWDRVVVSAHSKSVDAPAFVGPNRICLQAAVDAHGPLHAVVLPARRFVAVGGGGVVEEVERV